jgi:hypothetical protein
VYNPPRLRVHTRGFASPFNQSSTDETERETEKQIRMDTAEQSRSFKISGYCPDQLQEVKKVLGAADARIS